MVDGVYNFKTGILLLYPIFFDVFFWARQRILYKVQLELF